MGLINLVTNLPDFYYYNSKGQPGGLGNFSAKSLRYGKDKKGGGSSNQPFIQTPIPDESAPTSPDFLLRNGYLNPISSLQDVSRLTKFFSPFGPGASVNGTLFIIKQELLERQGVNTVDGINRVYNPLGTLAQAGVLSAGYHLNKQGINPFARGYFRGGKEGYYNITKLDSEVDINRLVGLYETNKLQKYNDILTISEYGLNITPNSQILLSYSGGPGSILGVGKTNIRLWNSTNKIKTPEESSIISFSKIFPLTPNHISTVWNYNPGSGINQKYNITGLFQSGIGVSFLIKTSVDSSVPNTTLWGESENASDVLNRNTLTSNTFTSTEPGYLTYNQIKNANNVTINSKGTILDFRESIPDVPSTDYTEFNRENGLYGHGYNTSKTYFKSNSRNGITRILNPNLAISPDQVEIGVRGEDIIDFNFTLVNNNSSKDGIQNTLIDFRAYIEDFNDSFNGEWDAYKYVGRGENFYKYKGFTRDLSITFLVPVLSRADLISTYQKLNALVWSIMPDYSGAGVMRGNLAYFTMGDYLRRSLTIIKSVSYTPIAEMGYDIDRDLDGRKFKNGEDSLYTGQLPKGIKVQCNLVPLTNEVVPQSNTFYTPQRGEAFIGNRTHTIVDRDNIAEQYINSKKPSDFQTNEAGQYTNSFKASNPNLSPIYTSLENTSTKVQEKGILEVSSTPPTQLNIPSAVPSLRSTLPNFASQFSNMTENTGEAGPQLPVDAIPTGVEGNFLINQNATAGPRI
jgi:hypothetical protein